MTTTNNPIAPLDLAQFDGHTPGDWSALSISYSGSRIETANRNIAALSLIGMCKIQGDAAPLQELDANARLIAAAPAMLSELRTLRARNAELRAALVSADAEMRYAVAAFNGNGNPTAAKKGLGNALCDSRAALAKQKGRAEG